MKYFDFVGSRKGDLDRLLLLHKAQPVGWGYIDTIIHRDEVKSAVDSISEIGFLIHTVSWWDYLKNRDQKSRIGMGGPISIFYPGWFAEISDYDDIEEEIHSSILGNYDSDLVVQSNRKVLENISSKTTKTFGGDSLSYRKDTGLTPGLWIEVPDDWINPFTNLNKIGFLPEYESLVEENRRRNCLTKFST